MRMRSAAYVSREPSARKITMTGTPSPISSSRRSAGVGIRAEAVSPLSRVTVSVGSKARTNVPRFYQPQTSFSRVIMGAHAVTVAVELQKSGEAVRQARRHEPAAIPSRPRRARHLIEVARAHYGRDDKEAAVTTLRQAYESAPETIRFNGYARQITLDLLDGPRSTRDDARDLAVKVGLLS
jgi:hypothetical protein